MHDWQRNCNGSLTLVFNFTSLNGEVIICITHRISLCDLLFSVALIVHRSKAQSSCLAASPDFPKKVDVFSCSSVFLSLISVLNAET